MTDVPAPRADVDGFEGSLIDSVVRAIESVEGCAGLSAGPAGTAATLLPGRRIAGLRIGDASTEVHISVKWGHDMRQVCESVRAKVTALVSHRVDVVVEDIEA